MPIIWPPPLACITRQAARVALYSPPRLTSICLHHSSGSVCSKRISDLKRVRRTSRRAADILWAAITSANLNTTVLPEPGFKNRGIALGQQSDRTSLFLHKQNGATALAFAERKIINA